MEQKLYDLLRIGLTEGEAKVYLALLELGSCTVGPIVKKSGVAYSNVYDILNRLLEKGIVSFIIKSKTKYFQPVGPGNLVEYLDKKEHEISKQKEALKKILPGLLKMQRTLPEQEAEIFVGMKGMKAVYEKMFADVKKGEPYLFFYVLKSEYSEQVDRFYWMIWNESQKGKGLAMRGIAHRDYEKSWLVKNMKHVMTLRYVNYPVPTCVDIFRDWVLIVSWLPHPVGFLIRSKNASDDFKKYFEAVWKTAKP